MERRFVLFLLLVLLLPLCKGDLFSQESEEIEELKARGRAHAEAGDFAAAELTFDSIFILDTNSISARNNLGVLYNRTGRYSDALIVLQEAEAIVKSEYGEDYVDLVSLYMNIGINYNQKKDFELALQYLIRAENIIKKQQDFNPNIASTVYNNMGNSYFGMNEYRKALNSYKKGIETKKAVNATGLDVSYANCASTYEKLDKVDSASLYYNYSIEAKIKRFGKDNYQLIPTYNNYAELLKGTGDFEKAYDYLSEALDIAHASLPPKHQLTATCYEKVGAWHLANGNPQIALENYILGINANVFDFSSSDLYVNPVLTSEILSEPVLLDLLIGKAGAMNSMHAQTAELDYLLGSLETLELANALTEKMRSSYLGEESKLLITEYARSVFDRSIQTAYDLYIITGNDIYANKAFVSAEKSKSSVLLASLQEVERKKNLAIPIELQVLEQDIKLETDVYKKKIYEERQRPEPDEGKLDNWQDRVFFLSRQLDSLDRVIREGNPEYASKFDNEVIDLPAAMEKLEDNQVLLEYSLNDSSLFIFMIENEGFAISNVDIGPEFHDHIGQLGDFLRNNDFANNTFDDYSTYCESAYALYSTFIKPYEDQLEGKKLLIIPDGKLGYIPFEALLSHMPDMGGMDYRSLPYLVYKYLTNYAYSATLFFTDADDRKEAEKQVLAFAPTYENMEDISGTKFPSYRDYATYLVPLRFISTEIRNISEIIECDTYEGFEATEKAFKEQAPSYNILHLAMHTLINDENPLYSRLVFTLNNDTLEDNDGLLNAYEIFNMELNARMAVLSACNTGSGKLQKGEGIMSMARGFIFAGVPSIIMTLWAVEDQAGSIMMSKFYQNLVEGMEIDKALQGAKLQYLAEADQLSAHPYLWSGYVNIGSTEAVVESSSGRVLQLITALIGLAVIILILIKVRKRRAIT